MGLEVVHLIDAEALDEETEFGKAEGTARLILG